MRRIAVIGLVGAVLCAAVFLVVRRETPATERWIGRLDSEEMTVNVFEQFSYKTGRRFRFEVVTGQGTSSLTVR